MRPRLDRYAIGCRDCNGIREGYDAGPFATLEKALEYIGDNESNIIVRLTDPPLVVAVWDTDRWIVRGKNSSRG